jgi:hypothetical protein
VFLPAKQSVFSHWRAATTARATPSSLRWMEVRAFPRPAMPDHSAQKARKIMGHDLFNEAASRKVELRPRRHRQFMLKLCDEVGSRLA